MAVNYKNTSERGVSDMPPVIDTTKCTQCGICAQICPLDVIRMDKQSAEREVIVKYPYECWHCRACLKDCPAQAIRMRYPLSHMMLTMDVSTAKGGKQECS